jgi:hypothetical protein
MNGISESGQIFVLFTVQAKLSNFQYRPSEKVPNPRMKHTDKHISKFETVLSVCNVQTLIIFIFLIYFISLMELHIPFIRDPDVQCA